MMIVSTRIVITTEPQRIVPASGSPQKVKLLNAGGEVVRVGGDASLTTQAYGLPRLPDSPNVPRTPFDFELNPDEELWAMVAQNTSELNVWYQRND